MSGGTETLAYACRSVPASEQHYQFVLTFMCCGTKRSSGRLVIQTLIQVYYHAQEAGITH